MAQRLQVMILAVVEEKFLDEQQLWRTNGKLEEALSTVDLCKLRAWEDFRWQAAYNDLARQRAEWESAGRSADDIDKAVAEWKDQARHVVAPWWCASVFCDDDFGSVFTFFLQRAVEIVTDTYGLYNIEMADARWDPFVGGLTKNKFEFSFTELEVLGIELSIQEGGWRRLKPSRAAAYADCGAELVGKKSARTKDVQGFIGRLIFSTQALAGLRGLIQRLLAALHHGWATNVNTRLNKEAWYTVELACQVLRDNVGKPLYPMESKIGAHGRRVCWCWTDAARQVEIDPTNPDKYSGFGVLVWPSGCDTVFSASGRWERCEEEELDSTALEMHVVNMGMEYAHATMAAVGWSAQEREDADIVMVGDNESTTGAGVRAKAHSPALRVLIEQGTARAAHRPRTRMFGAHVHRHMNEEADDGSKAAYPEMRLRLDARFGRRMRVAILPPPTNAWRSLGPTRLAMKRKRSGREAAERMESSAERDSSAARFITGSS